MRTTDSDHETELDLLLSDLGYLLRRELDRRVQQANLGLTRAQWLVLRQTATQEGRLQRELAEALGIEASTVARHVDRLVAAGWMERRDDAWDGRAYRLYLHPRARSVLLHLQGLTARLRDETFAGIPPERRAQLVDDLQRIKRNLFASPPRTRELPSVNATNPDIELVG
ncbi:MAG TPA: MarR family transcriptional regulator [Opitutaceae bacterium]|nr:MarR family transcriptional regulator [Opitutaceae bacterium]